MRNRALMYTCTYILVWVCASARGMLQRSAKDRPNSRGAVAEVNLVSVCVCVCVCSRARVRRFPSKHATPPLRWECHLMWCLLMYIANIVDRTSRRQRAYVYIWARECALCRALFYKTFYFWLQRIRTHVTHTRTMYATRTENSHCSTKRKQTQHRSR